jgi:hypothetical protein
MPIWARGPTGDPRPSGDRRWPVDQGEAIRLVATPTSTPCGKKRRTSRRTRTKSQRSSRKCSFCRKTDRRRLFGAEYLVRDPNTFAVIAQICICSDCVAKFAERLAQESPEAPSDTVVDGTDRPCRARPADPVPGRGGPERRQVHGPQGRQRPPGASVGPDSPRRQGRHRSGAAAAARLRTRARAAGTQRLPRDDRGRERAARRLHDEGPSAASWTSARCTSRGRRRSCSPTRS